VLIFESLRELRDKHFNGTDKQTLCQAEENKLEKLLSFGASETVTQEISATEKFLH
jgi:hypothetical protein